MRDCPRRWRARDCDEAGYSLIEMLVAIGILGIGLILSLTPVMSGFNLIAKTKATRIASNVAQARMEEVRSLTYLEVGFPSSSPPGVLTPVQTTTISNLTFTTTTAISFEGSATGNNVVPQGGDGVEGGFDFGIDYKRVTITVIGPRDIDPVVMQTIVSPGSLAAFEGVTNVVVNLVVEPEPDGLPSATDWPVMWLVRGDNTPVYQFTGVPGAEQVFAGIETNGSNIALPDYNYFVRLGPSLATVASGSWRIHEEDLDEDGGAVHAGPAETVDKTVRVHKVPSLTVRAVDSGFGSPVSGGILYVTHEGTQSIATATGTGEWAIPASLFGQDALRPGSYNFMVSAPGYRPSVVSATVVPEGYPSDLNHVETIPMSRVPNLVSTALTTLRTEDRPRDGSASRVMARIGVTLSGGSFASPLSIRSDSTGRVYVYQPTDETYSATAGSPYGHQDATVSSVSAGSTSLLRMLDPSGTRLVRLNLSGPGDFGYRTSGGLGDDFTRVPRNSTGGASIVVLPGSWEMTKLCDNLTQVATQVVSFTSGAAPGQWGNGRPSC